jgi:hypothetical protein
MNLTWKELRESVPPVFLALGVIVITLLLPAFSEHPRYGFYWGIGYHSSALAILFFVSLVLGVTAYAVEEEQETLFPLLAKPVPANDILATKLGVRLGLIFISWVFLGILELLTGAWPIEWNIPSPYGFERWVGAIMICALGLALGLYFGRRHGHQTIALLLAILVFAAGFIILNQTPVKFIFDGADGPTRWYPVRIIWIPALGAIAAVLMTIRMPEEIKSGVPAGLLTGTSLGLYALLLWSLTLLPVQLVWNSPSAYRDYWTMRFGKLKPSFETMVRLTYDEFTILPARDDQPEQKIPSQREQRLLSGLYLSIPAEPPTTYYDQLLGTRPWRPSPEAYGQLSRRSPYAIATDSAAEEFFVTVRPSKDLDALLEMGAAGELGAFERMMALHVAGVVDRPEQSDRIAAYLDDSDPDVQSIAALLLAKRGDDRAFPVLGELLDSGRREVQTKIVSLMTSARVDVGRNIRPIVEEWLRLPAISTADSVREFGNDFSARRRVALAWMKRFGGPADLPLIRQAYWANHFEYWRREHTPADVDVWDYLLGWSDPSTYPAIKQYLGEIVATRAGQIDRYFRYLDLPWRSRQRYDEEARWVSGFSNDVYNLYRGLGLLLQVHDPEALRYWELGRPMTYSFSGYRTDYVSYRYPVQTLLPRLAEYGPAGLAELGRLHTDRGTPPQIRFQAALLLAARGDEPAAREALRLWELYRGSAPDRLWEGDALAAFSDLLADGYLRFAGPILLYANAGYERNTGFTYYYWRGTRSMGHGWWNLSIIEDLKRGSGQDYGWDLKAWTKWWEREKVQY